jgi:hypothetical protein
MCPLRLLCSPFHQNFPSYFFTPSIFPGSAQADLVPFAATVSTARLRIPYFHCGFLLTPSIFPGSAQADLVLSADAVSTASHHQPLNTHLTASMIRFDSFFFIRFNGFKNSMCPLHLLYFSFHLCFPSCFLFHTSIFPGSAQADLVPFAAAVSTAGFIYLRVLRVPYGVLFTPSLPWVGAGRPCALRSCGFNRQSPDLRIESI